MDTSAVQLLGNVNNDMSSVINNNYDNITNMRKRQEPGEIQGHLQVVSH